MLTAPSGHPHADDGTVFRAGLLSTRDELKAQYDASKPYPHSVIRDLCNPDLLRQVRHAVCYQLPLLVGSWMGSAWQQLEHCSLLHMPQQAWRGLLALPAPG